jgi:hypothetical protein
MPIPGTATSPTTITVNSLYTYFGSTPQYPSTGTSTNISIGQYLLGGLVDNPGVTGVNTTVPSSASNLGMNLYEGCYYNSVLTQSVAVAYSSTKGVGYVTVSGSTTSMSWTHYYAAMRIDNMTWTAVTTGQAVSNLDIPYNSLTVGVNTVPPNNDLSWQWIQMNSGSVLRRSAGNYQTLNTSTTTPTKGYYYSQWSSFTTTMTGWPTVGSTTATIYIGLMV